MSGYFAQEKINLTKEISMMKLELSHDFQLSVGTSSKGIKFDREKYEKLKSALANATLEIPLLGKLGWKFLNGEVEILPRQNGESSRRRSAGPYEKSVSSARGTRERQEQAETIWLRAQEDIDNHIQNNTPRIPRAPTHARNTSQAQKEKDNKAYYEAMHEYTSAQQLWITQKGKRGKKPWNRTKMFKKKRAKIKHEVINDPHRTSSMQHPKASTSSADWTR